MRDTLIPEKIFKGNVRRSAVQALLPKYYKVFSGITYDLNIVSYNYCQFLKDEGSKIVMDKLTSIENSIKSSEILDNTWKALNTSVADIVSLSRLNVDLAVTDSPSLIYTLHNVDNYKIAFEIFTEDADLYSAYSIYSMDDDLVARNSGDYTSIIKDLNDFLSVPSLGLPGSFGMSMSGSICRGTFISQSSDIL